jgi:CDP-4-dehydro-6-deoxyglucose reductase
MTYFVQIKPSGYLLLVEEDETILAAALRQGFEIPYSCGSATCGTCMGKVLSGTYTYGTVEPYALSTEQRAEQYALFCSVRPTSDLIIELEDVYSPNFIPVQKAEYTVADYKIFPHDIYQVFLEPEKKKITYHAGQHIKILCRDGITLPFSIANAPTSNGNIELHIKHIAQNPYTSEIIEKIIQKKSLELRGPYGKMQYCPELPFPMIFISGSNGLVPLKALIEEALASKDNRKLHLYWGCKIASELYLKDYFQNLTTQHPNFKFTPIVAEQTLDWQGTTKLITDAIIQEYPHLDQQMLLSKTASNRN